NSAPAQSRRDHRVDFLRGLALAIIFVNHVQGNFYEKLTPKNFGFSDAAESFVILAGFASAYAYLSRFARGEICDAVCMAWRSAAHAVLQASLWPLRSLPAVRILVGTFRLADQFLRHRLAGEDLGFRERLCSLAAPAACAGAWLCGDDVAAWPPDAPDPEDEFPHRHGTPFATTVLCRLAPVDDRRGHPL